MKTELKILVIIVGLILVLPMVIAEADRGKLNDDMNIRKSITLNGTLVNTANITVYNPDGLLIVAFAEMQRNILSNDFNYTIVGENISVLGVYDYTICGFATTEKECFGLQFEVTGTGFDINQFPFPFTLLIISFIAIGAGHFSRKLRLMKFMGAVLLMVVGVYTLYPGYNGIDSNDLIGLTIGVLSIAGGFFFLIEDFLGGDDKGFYETWEDEA